MTTHTPAEDTRADITEQAEQAAEERCPALNPDDEELTYPRSAIRHHARGGFIAGYEAGYQAGLLAAPLPDRDTLVLVIRDADLRYTDTGATVTAGDYADAVLAFLRGGAR